MPRRLAVKPKGLPHLSARRLRGCLLRSLVAHPRQLFAREALRQKVQIDRVGSSTQCSDGVVCNGSERCMGGACVPGSALDWVDADLCTAEARFEPGGCGAVPVAGCCNVDFDCDDADVCTADTCSGPGGTCSHTPIPDCCNEPADCDDGDVCTVDEPPADLVEDADSFALDDDGCECSAQRTGGGSGLGDLLPVARGRRALPPPLPPGPFWSPISLTEEVAMSAGFLRDIDAHVSKGATTAIQPIDAPGRARPKLRSVVAEDLLEVDFETHQNAAHPMAPEVKRSVTWGAGTTVSLGVLILVGSRNLAYFDAALVAYTFSILFATFGLTYRYMMWLSRPPTSLYWRRGWQAFWRRGWRLHNARFWLSRVSLDLLANRFIFQRERLRGLTHLLIMWGCIVAAAITFPLVFGWLHFRPVAGDLALYEAVIFGFAAFRFPHDSALGFFLFHGLVWASFLVIAGVMLAMRRRMREEGAAALQRFAEDFLPLILLFAVSVTGLMLTASYTWMKGYGFTFISILHAVTVIGTFIWLPFGKFFHIFQRPAQLGVGFYKDIGRSEEKAHCRRCGHAFTSRMHVLDLIEVEEKLGYRYQLPDGDIEHYQWICPPCRRASFGMAQGLRWKGRRGGAPLPSESGPMPMPVSVNRGLGEGPLDAEDAENFHP